LKITKILIFGGISNFCLWTNFVKFWAKFAALTMAESMPKVRLKSLKPFNSSTVNPNATWSISLESYHLYLEPQKNSKNPQTYYVHNTLPKSAKSHFGCLCLLGFNHSKLDEVAKMKEEKSSNKVYHFQLH
jgi:hypothetical protein